jgi:hypothetical protein
MLRIWKCWFAVIVVLAGSPSFSASTTQNFDLAGHGELTLRIPDGWQGAVRNPDNGLPPTILFRTRSDKSFQLLITAVWTIPPNNEVPDVAKIRSIVSNAAEGAKAHAVEKALPLQELVGPNSHGYYFSATDRAPAPGEWKYLTQGATRVGAIALTFTILTNDGQEADAKAALELIRLAIQKAPNVV